MFPAKMVRLRITNSGRLYSLTIDRLYLDNVGDARAVFVYRNKWDGSLQFEQLSEDHNVESEREK